MNETHRFDLGRVQLKHAKVGRQQSLHVYSQIERYIKEACAYPGMFPGAKWGGRVLYMPDLEDGRRSKKSELLLPLSQIIINPTVETYINETQKSCKCSAVEYFIPTM